MREDLNAFGNELNYYNVACRYFLLDRKGLNADVRQHCMYVLRGTKRHQLIPLDVLGQVPLMTLQTKKRM